MLIRIEAPHFVAGVVLENGRVTRTAPIVKYMKGWTEAHIRHYCVTKDWGCRAYGP